MKVKGLKLCVPICLSSFIVINLDHLKSKYLMIWRNVSTPKPTAFNTIKILWYEFTWQFEENKGRPCIFSDNWQMWSIFKREFPIIFYSMHIVEDIPYFTSTSFLDVVAVATSKHLTLRITLKHWPQKMPIATEHWHFVPRLFVKSSKACPTSKVCLVTFYIHSINKQKLVL